VSSLAAVQRILDEFCVGSGVIRTGGMRSQDGTSRRNDWLSDAAQILPSRGDCESRGSYCANK
jgi:hypothetical protein